MKRRVRKSKLKSIDLRHLKIMKLPTEKLQNNEGNKTKQTTEKVESNHSDITIKKETSCVEESKDI